MTDYFEGALAPAERARFEAHIADCPGCDRRLAQMHATVTLAGASRAVEATPDVGGLLAAFRDWKRSG